jgi:hypothetical protein
MKTSEVLDLQLVVIAQATISARAALHDPSQAQADWEPSLIAAFTGNIYLDRKRMIYHVGAVVRVMLVRLHAAVRIFGTCQQGVLSRILRCKPI